MAAIRSRPVANQALCGGDERTQMAGAASRGPRATEIRQRGAV